MTDDRKPLEPATAVNHKGERCIFTGKLCQEGYCSSCQIWLNHLKPPK